MDRYLQAIGRTLEQMPGQIAPLDTIYLGGGTPSVLGAKRIGILLEEIFHRFSVKSDAEITIECNPAPDMLPDFQLMHAAGANRLSMGMQSVNNAQLKILGRRHTCADLQSAVTAAQKAGFENLSLDLMLATPGQTKADIDAAVSLCDGMGVTHLSAYLLKIEEGTSFFKNHMEKNCPDEDAQAEIYLYAAQTIEQHGYQQYEISNFAKDGKISRHNFKYWDAQEYLGIGPSAHGFYLGKRYFFPRNLTQFLLAENPWELIQQDGIGGNLEEYLMLRLRLCEGIRWDMLKKRDKQFDLSELQKRAMPMQRAGLLCCDETGIRLTKEGFLLSNTIIGGLLC